MGAALNDTEVMHDLNLVENLETQLLDECDIEVVPDSDDDEESHFTVHSELEETPLLKDGKTSVVKDTNLVNPISPALQCADGSKQLSEGIECDNDVKTHRRKIREVRIVYTRKRKRMQCSFEDKAEKEEARAPNNTRECAGLTYVDSQDPEDLYKALYFVDKYVSVNALDSSPEAYVNLEDKSPLLVSGKRVHSLVRLAKLKDRAQEIGNFEWDDSYDTEQPSDYMGKRGQLSFKGRKYGKTYIRKSPNLKDVLLKVHENPGITRKEKTECFNINEPRKDLSHLDANLAVYDFKIAEEIKQADEKKVVEDSDTELDLTTNQDCTVTQFENCAVHEESEHIFDVGIDTQIAAEAIQALSFASPSDCSNIDADQCRQTLEGTQKTYHPGLWWSFPKKTRSASRPIKKMCSDKQKDIMQISELDWRKKGEKLNEECVDESMFEKSGKGKFVKKENTKGAKALNTNGFKENKKSIVSEEETALCKLKRRRKQQDVPLDVNLNLSSLLNTNEGLINEYLKEKSNHMKDGLPDKRKQTSSTLEVSTEMEKHSKLLCEKTGNSGMMKLRKEKKTFLGTNEFAVNASGDKGKEESNSLNTLNLKDSSLRESFCNDQSSKIDDTGNTKSIQEDASYASPQGSCLSDSPNGKQIGSSILSNPERSPGLECSSVKTSTNQSNHCPSKSQSMSESLLNSSSSVSNTKRKRRSSVYVLPNSISFKAKCKRSYLLHTRVEPRQNKVHNSDSAVEKKRNNVSNHVMSPNYPPLRDETNVINVIDDHYEQSGKKKVISPTFSRELVRLGFNESIPGLISKDSRRRKTMANIRVMLSQNLDKDIVKHQKKILMRLGVPMVFSPSDATHFIADKFARTRNMLESIAQGKPVVTHIWLESCEQAGFYMDEKSFILRDVKKEQELGFKMPLSLDLARKHPLLMDYRVSITPNAQPGLDLLTSLVKASQGQAVGLIKDCTKITLDNLLILSCEEDKDYCVPFLKRGVAVYSSELILNGIIIQKLEFERHRLFAKHGKGR